MKQEDVREVSQKHVDAKKETAEEKWLKQSKKEKKKKCVNLLFFFI